jgi:hypothetical protein
MQWKKVASAPAMAAIALVAGFGGGVVTSELRARGLVPASFPTVSFRDPLAIMGARSPGLREAGLLTQTKPSQRVLPTLAAADAPPAAANPLAPSERVLSGERMRPPGTALPDGFAPVQFAGLGPLNTGPISIPGVTDPGSSLFPPFGPGGPFIYAPGPINNGGEPNPPPAAVPEPATWLSMLAGFLLVGWGVRRRRTNAAGKTSPVRISDR